MCGIEKKKIYGFFIGVEKKMKRECTRKRERDEERMKRLNNRKVERVISPIGALKSP